jgi:hypothetical protein
MRPPRAGESIPPRSLDRPVFIGGAPRSGLTLLRMIIDMHPAMACPPDPGVLLSLGMQWQDIDKTLGGHLEKGYQLDHDRLRQSFRSMIEKLLVPSLALAHKPRLAVKSEMNAIGFDAIGALFPDARMILVVRDGRDVTASLLGRDWRDPATGAPFAYTQSAAAAALFWTQLVRLSMEAISRLVSPARVLIVRFEDLVEAPEKTLRTICAHIDVPWDTALLEFHRHPRPLIGTETESRRQVREPISPRSVGRWRRELSNQQVAEIRPTLDALLAEWGYLDRLAW